MVHTDIPVQETLYSCSLLRSFMSSKDTYCALSLLTKMSSKRRTSLNVSLVLSKNVVCVGDIVFFWHPVQHLQMYPNFLFLSFVLDILCPQSHVGVHSFEGSRPKSLNNFIASSSDDIICSKVDRFKFCSKGWRMWLLPLLSCCAESIFSSRVKTINHGLKIQNITKFPKCSKVLEHNTTTAFLPTRVLYVFTLRELQFCFLDKTNGWITRKFHEVRTKNNEAISR